jgi:hypothetical protein
MYKLYLVTLSVLFLASCSKDQDPQPAVSNTDYFPNTTGSTWTYTGIFDAEMVVTGETSEFDSEIYYEIESTNTAGSSSSYLFKNNGHYYMRGFVSDAADLNLLVLKDNVNEAATWEQTISANGLNTIFRYTLTDKNIEEVIDGTTFENVIVVRMDQSYEFLGTEFPLSTITFYFAKGVGIIKIDTQYDPSTGLESLNGISELESYEIQ